MKIFDMESHQFADIFPLIEGEQLEQLKEDIKEHGLLQPVILFEGKILDGRNRFKACKEIGVEPSFKEYKGNKPLEYVISENLKRRHLTASQRAVVAVDVLPLLEEEARKRQLTLAGTRPNKDLVVNLPQGDKGKSSVQAGKLAQVGEKYVREIKKLRDEGKKATIEEIRKGTKTIQEIKKEEKKEKIAIHRAKIQKEILEQPEGDFDIIVVDPPWQYDDKEIAGAVDYPSLSLNELKKIKLPTKEDCVLWLWVTNAFFKEAFELLLAWGFKDKTVLTWFKGNAGMGHYLRNVTEHCILAVKGEPLKKGLFMNNNKFCTFLDEKKTSHSTKPESFYKMVDEICVGRKLDYFARKKRDGWCVYGDEIK